MTKSELELAQNLAGAKYPEQYVRVMQDMLRKLLEEREQLLATIERVTGVHEEVWDD